MSSTDASGRGRAALERFHARRILPLAQAPGWRTSETAPDPGLASYWLPRDGRTLQASDFELAMGDPREIARTLDARWRGTPLAGLGRLLVRLGRRFAGRAARSELSSDVYEMF
jgi:hypothetical protein